MTTVIVLIASFVTVYFLMASIGAIEASIQDGQLDWVAKLEWTIAIRLAMLVTAIYLFFSQAVYVNPTLAVISILWVSAYSLSGIYLVSEMEYKKSTLIEWSDNPYSLLTTSLTIVSMMSLIILTV